MGTGFGERLRQERRTRGLTQAELGNGVYSPSYISLLETGRREPTPDVIQELSQRLGVSSKELEEWNQRVAESDAQYVLAALYARQAWDLRDFDLALEHATHAADVALLAKNNSAWWNMTYMQAECYLKQGRLDECRETLQVLLGHRMAADSDGLIARALQMLAAVAHGQGHLTEAVELSQRAVQRGKLLPSGSPVYIGSLRMYIGALAELGRLNEAWENCLLLAEQVNDRSMPHLAGEVAWVIGNVAFMRHDYQEGVRQHERAAELLSPAKDVEQWANFNKASAAMRLNSGIIEPATLAALERAELAHTIVRGRESDRLELAFIRSKWLYLNGELSEAIHILLEVNQHQKVLGRHTAADVELLLGRSYKATGDFPSALEHLAQAQSLFSEAAVSDGIQQAMDAMLEIRLAERRAKSA